MANCHELSYFAIGFCTATMFTSMLFRSYRWAAICALCVALNYFMIFTR